MPKNSEKWLRVIGIGEDGWEDLGADAKLLLYESQVVLGGERHLKMLPDDWKGKRISWTSPMRESVEKILSFRPDRFNNVKSMSRCQEETILPWSKLVKKLTKQA